MTVDIDCRAQQAGRRIAGRPGSREDRQAGGEERRYKEVLAPSLPPSTSTCIDFWLGQLHHCGGCIQTDGPIKLVDVQGML